MSLLSPSSVEQVACLEESSRFVGIFVHVQVKSADI